MGPGGAEMKHEECNIPAAGIFTAADWAQSIG
jgi:hypothetical protein